MCCIDDDNDDDDDEVSSSIIAQSSTSPALLLMGLQRLDIPRRYEEDPLINHRITDQLKDLVFVLILPHDWQTSSPTTFSSTTEPS